MTDDPQHLQARIRELEDASVEGDAVLIEMGRALHPPSIPCDALPVARMDFSDEQWARLEAAAAIACRELQAQVEGCRGALEEIAAEEFKGPLGISIYQAAANELSRIKAVARQALALLKEPGNGK